MDTCQLRLAWPESVCLVSGYTSVSPVFAPFWHARLARKVAWPA